MQRLAAERRQAAADWQEKQSLHDKKMAQLTEETRMLRTQLDQRTRAGAEREQAALRVRFALVFFVLVMFVWSES